MADERPAPLRFSNELKIRRQMQKRGCTDVELREALQSPALPANGKAGPAFRYVHPRTGKSVIVDAASGDIFHVGKDGYRDG